MAVGTMADRHSHPLLNAFPLAVMTLATFLVVFALLMARLTAGVDPALRTGASSALVRENASGSAVRTRASTAAATGGAAGANATPIAASEGSSGTAPAIVTSSSGARGSGRGGDD